MMGMSLEPALGPRLLWSSGLAPGTVAATGALEESQVRECNFTTSSPPRAGKPVSAPGETWILEVTGRIKMQWEGHRGGVPQLGLWSLAGIGIVPEKLGSQVTPGDE